MYYVNKNFYINNDQNILFDLKNGGIYEISKEFANLLDKEGNIKENDCLNKEEKTLYEKISQVSSRVSNNKIQCFKIHVSNACNLRCKYCYANQGNYGSEDKIMSTNTTKKVINFINNYLKQNELKYITFFGGEPCLAVDSMKMICEEFYTKGIKFLIQTNGTILDDEIMDLFYNYNFNVTVSLDGPKDLNDLNRINSNGMGTHDLIINNIKKLNANKKAIKVVQSTISSDNTTEYEKAEICDYIYNYTNIPLIKVEYDINHHIYNTTTENINNEISTFFNRLILKGQVLDGYEYKFLKVFFSSLYNNHFCSAGNNFLTIDVNGDIYPCQLFINKKDYFMGNIDDLNILESYNYKQVTAQLSQKTKSTLNNCQHCIARCHCNRCIAKDNIFDDCNYIRQFTEKFLEIFSEYIKAGKIYDIYNVYTKVN